jgi:protein-tyrosine-phosphatase
MQQMADASILMLNEAMRGFDEQHAELAEGTKRMAAEIDRIFGATLAHLVEAGQTGAVQAKVLLASLTILSTLDRVSDQAKNICEDTLFSVTGEMKKTKRFKILFLDRTNESVSHMARAIAQKRYPESGYYACAGTEAAAALDPAYVRFMEHHGFEMSGSTPLPYYNSSDEDLQQYHVIVGLNSPVRGLVPEIPFHTIALHWEVPAPPEPGAGPEEQEARYQEIYRHLATQIGDLLQTLHGEVAT